MEMTTAIHDDEPDGRAARRRRRTLAAGGDARRTSELLWRAGMNNARRPMHAGRVMARAVPQLGRLQRQIQPAHDHSAADDDPAHPLERAGHARTVCSTRVRLDLDELRADQGDRARGDDQRRRADHRRRRRCAPTCSTRASCPPIR